MDIQRKNTLEFLSRYAEEVIEEAKREILRKRKRDYGDRVTNAPLEASGDGRESLEKVSKEDGFDILGNDYLESIDEGTSSTVATLSDILRWIDVKPVKLRDRKGRLRKMTQKTKEAFAKNVVENLKSNGLQRTAFLTDLVNKSVKGLDGIENAVVDDILLDIDKILRNYGLVKKGDEYTLDTKR